VAFLTLWNLTQLLQQAEQLLSGILAISYESPLLQTKVN